MATKDTITKLVNKSGATLHVYSAGFFIAAGQSHDLSPLDPDDLRQRSDALPVELSGTWTTDGGDPSVLNGSGGAATTQLRRGSAINNVANPELRWVAGITDDDTISLTSGFTVPLAGTAIEKIENTSIYNEIRSLIEQDLATIEIDGVEYTKAKSVEHVNGIVQNRSYSGDTGALHRYTGPTPPDEISGDTVWIEDATNDVFFYDQARGLWMGPENKMIFGASTSTSAVVSPVGVSVPSIATGYAADGQHTITKISAASDGGNDAKEFEIYHVTTTGVENKIPPGPSPSFALAGSRYINNNLTYTFNHGLGVINVRSLGGAPVQKLTIALHCRRSFNP